MSDSKRWNVTYTKHIKQKRKLYQDGFLQLQIPTNKVTLYDECDKLLSHKILKSEETVASGETLEFNGYLVDIGDPEEEVHIKIEPDAKFETTPKAGSRFRTPSAGTKINAAKGKIASIRKPLSPSQQIIKEFKKRELLKYGSPTQVSPETTKPSTTEWQVLYTTQVTQKARKYHDGFIRLVSHGSHGGQVMLFDASRKLLNSRFLKKDDVIRSGESIAFDAHLVDIGERQENHKSNCSVQEENCNDVEKVKNQKMDRQPASFHVDTSMAVGKSEWRVLYTKQITQRAKKYHDGFLRLELCGSHGRQVILYDSTKNPLERRFLKKDEVVSTGEALFFDGHLVDIGESEGDHQPCIKLNEQGTGNAVVQKRLPRHVQNGGLKVTQCVSKEQPPGKPSIGEDAGLNFLSPGIGVIESIPKKEDLESKRMVSPVKPLRDANEILSILQFPMPHKSCVIGGQLPNGSCHNVVDNKSTESMKSLDSQSFSKGKSQDIGI